MYANQYKDVLPPSRMPAVDNDHWRVEIAGGWKYRPTFMAMIAHHIDLPPFAQPLASRTLVDRFGQPGDRQNYYSDVYVCPEASEWRDERNSGYGYNYQFMGNSRLSDESRPTFFKNWPVKTAAVRAPAECVAVGDSMGTAASYPANRRGLNEDNTPGSSSTGRSAHALGNEGFNLDPPRVDAKRGEMAGFDDSPQHRSAIHPRHGKRANILWVDGHVSAETMKSLLYQEEKDGTVGFDGDNRFFHIRHVDEAWTPAGN